MIPCISDGLLALIPRGSLCTVLLIAAVVLGGMARHAESRPLNHAEAQSAGWSVLELSPHVAEELTHVLQAYPAMTMQDAKSQANATGEVVLSLIAEYGPPSRSDAFALNAVFPDMHGPIETPEGHRFGTIVPFHEMSFEDFLANIVWLHYERPRSVESDGTWVFQYRFSFDHPSHDEELAALERMSRDDRCVVAEAQLHLEDIEEVPLRPDPWRFRPYQEDWYLGVEMLRRVTAGLPLLVSVRGVAPYCIPPSVPGGHVMQPLNEQKSDEPTSTLAHLCRFRIEGRLSDQPIAVLHETPRSRSRIPLEQRALVAACSPSSAHSASAILLAAYPIENDTVVLDSGQSVPLAEIESRLNAAGGAQ